MLRRHLFPDPFEMPTHCPCGYVKKLHDGSELVFREVLQGLVYIVRERSHDLLDSLNPRRKHLCDHLAAIFGTAFAEGKARLYRAVQGTGDRPGRETGDLCQMARSGLYG